MEGLKIVALCTAAAVLYGILHDLVTANLCVEYFTVGHPPIFATDNPWLLALCWGVVASWWMGASFGLLVAAAARIGESPTLDWRQCLRPLRFVLLASAVAAASAGVYVLLTSRNDPNVGLDILGHRYSQHTRLMFMVDWSAHTMSYAASAIGALVLCGVLIGQRVRRSRGATPSPLS